MRTVGHAEREAQCSVPHLVQGRGGASLPVSQMMTTVFERGGKLSLRENIRRDKCIRRCVVRGKQVE